MIGGEDSVAQVLLGIFVSTLWLCLVLYKRPYVAFWDNALSAMLSFVVMSTLLCGMALRQYELTKAGKDDNEQSAFGMVLVLVNAVSLAVSLMVISCRLPRRPHGRSRRMPARPAGMRPTCRPFGVIVHTGLAS